MRQGTLSITSACSAAMISVLYLAFAAPSASGQSLGFMPGDAFYVFVMEEKLLDSFPAEGGTIVLPYMDPYVPFGSYFGGFRRLQIEGVPKEYLERLRRLYEFDREYRPKIVQRYKTDDGETHEREMNPPIAFVYNRGIDWSKQELALKYNENWANLPDAAFGDIDRRTVESDQIVEWYQPLVATAEAIKNDWQGCLKFSGLNVRVPPSVPWGLVSAKEPVQSPVVGDFRDLQIIVTTTEELLEYFAHTPLTVFYEVHGDGIDTLHWEDALFGGGLIREPLDLSPDNQALLRAAVRKIALRYYYGVRREGRRSGDITLPIWPGQEEPRPRRPHRVPADSDEFDEASDELIPLNSCCPSRKIDP